MKQPLTAEDVAKRLGVSARRVRALVKAGKLRSTQIGGIQQHLFDELEVERFSKLVRPPYRPYPKPAKKTRRKVGS